MVAEKSDELWYEFCLDMEYNNEDLDDNISVMFRFCIKDPAIYKSLESFEQHVKQTFLSMKVKIGINVLSYQDMNNLRRV